MEFKIQKSEIQVSKIMSIDLSNNGEENNEVQKHTNGNDVGVSEDDTSA